MFGLGRRGAMRTSARLLGALAAQPRRNLVTLDRQAVADLLSHLGRFVGRWPGHLAGLRR